MSCFNKLIGEHNAKKKDFKFFCGSIYLSTKQSHNTYSNNNVILVIYVYCITVKFTV